jgi:hypothetical protein
VGTLQLVRQRGVTDAKAWSANVAKKIALLLGCGTIQGQDASRRHDRYRKE